MKKKNTVKLITISLISELNDSVRHLNWTKDKAELLACGVNECNLGNGYKLRTSSRILCHKDWHCDCMDIDFHRIELGYSHAGSSLIG